MVRNDSLKSICVAVDNPEVVFQVARNLVCLRSTFFAAACSERWSQGRVSPICLPDYSPDVFSAYLEVLHTDRLNYGVNDEPESSLERTDWVELMRLYMLADKLGDIFSADSVMNEILERCEGSDVDDVPSAMAITLRSPTC